MTHRELCHYGVKGMKWGVRRYQNKDGSLTREGRKRYIPKNGKDFTMPKKVPVYRWSSKSDESLDNRRKYGFFTGGDMQRYVELFDDDRKSAKLIKMIPSKDLKVAGYKESTKAILKAYGDKRLSDLDLNKYTDDDLREVLRRHFTYINSSSEGDLANIFDLSIKSVPGDTKDHGKKVINELLNKKYDAMVDVYDKTTQFGDMPIILLNPQKSIKSYNTYDYSFYENSED